MRFLFIKGDVAQDVRMSKYISCLTGMGHEVDFWGWDRTSKNIGNPLLHECRYLYRGGGFGGKVALRYPMWMIRLFFVLLFERTLASRKILAVNFDAALPIFLACAIRRKKFIYEVLDEFAISYKFPRLLIKIIRWIDHIIMRGAEFVIHVDNNRISYKRCKYIVIENAPEDYWKGQERQYSQVQRKFAIVGCLSRGRGVDSICDFAEDNPEIQFLVVGKFADQYSEKRIKRLPNIECHERMPQMELFRHMEKCCGIFSLYDPSIEINRLAASNKVYDAMMMGIPVVTNKEVLNSAFIQKEKIGVVVDYAYDETWNELKSLDFVSRAGEYGRRGRKLYVERYQFGKMLDQRLMPALQENRRG